MLTYGFHSLGMLPERPGTFSFLKEQEHRVGDSVASSPVAGVPCDLPPFLLSFCPRVRPPGQNCREDIVGAYWSGKAR